VLAVVAVLLAGAAIVLWLITRDIGPAYSNGTYTVHTAGGATRVDHITPEAATSFEAKAPPPAGTLDVSRLGPADLVRLRLTGITFSEEEVNAELAKRLAGQPIEADGISVDRLFLELHAEDTRAYLYTSVYGLKVTFSARVTFAVRNQQAHVTLSDVHAGKMPIGFLLPALLDWTGNTAALEDRLALALPTQVTAIQTKEGGLHVDVDPLRFGRRPWPSLGGLATAGSSPGRRLIRLFGHAGGPGLSGARLGRLTRPRGSVAGFRPGLDPLRLRSRRWSPGSLLTAGLAG
ncbi:MAG TPA: hypothetical protein VH916_07730, partial [Dehalococcoidia bacterium]